MVGPVQYDDIPVEVSGEGCPEPMLAFEPSILGEALTRNLKLANYEKPTPVQKYSVPIGELGSGVGPVGTQTRVCVWPCMREWLGPAAVQVEARRACGVGGGVGWGRGAG